tara:strand:+ start:182 stop:313 length:132 start_codon:yes stop_codon:yes gene_type:complete
VSEDGFTGLGRYKGFFNRGRNGNKAYSDTLSKLIVFFKKGSVI